MKNIIIGTSGHIDHGKTTLIKALTGHDTDRLKEEKKRGISIDLGFTDFILPTGKKAGIIDVPGHEKFIKNMLAGVHGMDLVMLVIAADEGIMPQTKEHMEILNFLNIKKGIIVLTKSDMVENDFIDLVIDDIKDQVKNSFLKDAPIICVDSISLKGISELKILIDEMTDEIEDKNLNTNPRLNVDRVFSVKGFGTVVTGTLIEGTLDLDQEIMIYPKQIQTKVRGLQVHSESVKKAYAGQRVAINLASIKMEEVERGDVISALNSFNPTMMLDMKIKSLDSISRSIKYWERIRLYLGSKEVLGRIVPLDREEILPSQECYAQIRLEEEIVAKKLDNAVLRFYSPLETIAGGKILDANPKKHKRFDEKLIKMFEEKENGNENYVVENLIRENKKSYFTMNELSKIIAEPIDKIKEIINELEIEEKVYFLNSIIMHKEKLEILQNQILKILNDFHLKNRLKKGYLKEELRSKIDKNIKNKDFDEILKILQKKLVIKISEKFVSLYNFNVEFTKIDIELKNKIETNIKSFGYSPERIQEIIKTKEEQEILEAILGDTLIRISEEYVYSIDFYNKAMDTIRNLSQQNKGFTLAEFRDETKTSRKYAMLLLEYFDQIKFTKREGEKRILC